MKKHEYKITKSLVEVYRFRAEGAPYWAYVTIDSAPDAKHGRISIASDFGNWNYYWDACGSPFRKFLASCDLHYVAGKFGADKFFDADATIDEYKRIATDTFTEAEGSLLNAMTQIQHLELTCTNKDDFIRFLSSSDGDIILRMCDSRPELITKLDPGFKNFWEQIWPLLLEEFKREATPPRLEINIPPIDRSKFEKIMAHLDTSANEVWSFPPTMMDVDNFNKQVKEILPLTDELTLEFLKDETNTGRIFATGVVNEPVLHTDPVRWIAKVGNGYHDWAIYYHNEKESIGYIKAYGNKVTTDRIIRMLVPCTDEALNAYRR